MQASQSCPRCGTTLPVYHGFVTWCDKCSWNVTAPPIGTRTETRFDRLYSAAGKRLGNRLADQLLAVQSLEPRLTPARVAAYVIAALIHVTTFAFAVGGVLLVVLTFPNVAAIVVGGVLVLLACVMRPRLGKVPTEDVLSREEAAALYSLVDSVARALEVPDIDVVVLDHDFNASWAVLGFRRRRVMTLGLPILAMLGPQERVALIAHERNGDSTRSLVVGSATHALTAFYWAIAPEHFGEASAWSELAIFERLVNVVLWVISRPVLGVLLLEIHLLLRDSQRAEYLADALAAEVAGTQGVVSLHEHLLLESMFQLAVQRTARERNGADLFKELERLVARLPDRERERRRRVARLEDSRLDSTHPPTARRLELLEDREARAAAVVCEDEQTSAIDAELSTRRESAEAALLDDYRDSLYAH